MIHDRERDQNRPADPRDRDASPGLFNQGPLGVSPAAADWRKSPAGRFYLAGNNDTTIMPRPW